MRISNSFSEGEVQVLEFMLQTLLRGGSPVMATRHKDFGSLYRKVLSMKKRMTTRDEPSLHSEVESDRQRDISSVERLDVIDPQQKTG